MLVVFKDVSRESLAQSLGIVTWYNDLRNEDFNYCVAREKAQEVLTCRVLGIPYVVVTGGHDSRVIDTNADLKSLSEATQLVLRCHPGTLLPKSIAQIPKWISDAEIQRVSSWPNFVTDPDRFLKRFVMTMERDLLAQACLTGSLAFPLFIKTLEKTDFHKIISSQAEMQEQFISVEAARKSFPYKLAQMEGLPDDSVVLAQQYPDWYCEYREQMIKGRLNLNTLEGGVIVSEVMDIERAPGHKGEYRGYFINGQLSSISAYLDYEHVEVPAEIVAFAKEFGQAQMEMAKAFVADFCLSDKGPVLIEMNDFCHSGRYIDNNPTDLFVDIKRHFGDPEFRLTAPTVRVPSKADTEPPEVEGHFIDFGVTANLSFAEDDALVAKKQLGFQQEASVEKSPGNAISPADPFAEHFQFGS